MAKKVLIIDDEADIRTFLETLLTENGFETATASDGDKGWEAVQKLHPDVITLDIIMPRETGVKFYRRLLKDPALADIPVVVLSGVTRYRELFARDHKTMSRPFAFVEKPIQPDELVKKVMEAVASGKTVR